jgi:hypothetical protein
VVFPAKTTWVPELSPVMSRVVPDGTVMPDSTIVAQDFFDLEAEAALVNVHVVALFSRFGAAVGSGAAAATGEAATRETEVARRPRRVEI